MFKIRLINGIIFFTTNITAIIVIDYYSILLIVFWYRFLCKFFPIPIGPLTEEFKNNYDYYILFLLFVVHPISKSGLLPVPLNRLFYKLFGAQVGKNSVIAGVLTDPLLVTIGNNCVIGENTRIVSHVIESSNVEHYRTVIGDHSVIGTGSVLLPGVLIGKNCIIAAGSIVSKSTIIEDNEVWGGIPAKKLYDKNIVPV